MRIARFSYGEAASASFAFGAVEGDEIAVIDGHPFGEVALTGSRLPLSGVRLLPPILPSKIVAIGKNYADHAREMGGEPPAEPVMFLKPSTSVIGPAAPIVYPTLSQQVDFEGELAVVIGRLCRDVPVDKANDVVLGYTCANDVTARDLQRSDGQWTRAKGFDTFCAIGPEAPLTGALEDLEVLTRVNGVERQHGRARDMVFAIPMLLAYISGIMTLEPGDVVATGTPEGVGPLAPGDTVEVEIPGVSRVRNPVTRSA